MLFLNFSLFGFLLVINFFLLLLVVMLQSLGFQFLKFLSFISTPGYGLLTEIHIQAGLPTRSGQNIGLNKGLVINYGEGGGYKMGKSRVRNFLRPPLKT